MTYIQKSIALELGVSEDDIKILRQEESPGSKKGDNYMCDIKAVSVVAEIQGETKTFEYILKCSSLVRSEMMEKFRMFEKECVAFTWFFPLLKELGDKKGLLVPEAFHVSNEEGVIVMENLKAQSFKMASKKMDWDPSVFRMILKDISKLHAYSHHLLLERRDEMAENLFLEEDMDMESEMIVFCAFFRGHASILREGGFSTLANKLEDFISRVPDVQKRAFGREESGFSVLNHGDCWSNNFLFKYDDEKEDNVVDIRILDWQVLITNSPVRDLSHLLATCTSPKYRKEHLDELLKYYHESLGLYLEDVGLVVGEVYPLDEFLREYEDFGAERLLLQNIMMPFIMSKTSDSTIEITDETLKNEDSATENQFEAMIRKILKNDPSYLNLIADIMTEAVENNVF